MIVVEPRPPMLFPIVVVSVPAGLIATRPGKDTRQHSR